MLTIKGEKKHASHFIDAELMYTSKSGQFTEVYSVFTSIMKFISSIAMNICNEMIKHLNIYCIHYINSYIFYQLRLIWNKYKLFFLILLKNFFDLYYYFWLPVFFLKKRITSKNESHVSERAALEAGRLRPGRWAHQRSHNRS